MRERRLIEIIGRLTTNRRGVELGIGDDAAVLATDPPLLAAHDMLVEDVHFTRSTASAGDIGHKALAVNLSDIAAMGGVPLAALVGLALPDEVVDADVEAFYEGMESLAARHGVTIAGGDLTRSAVMSVGVTVLGQMPIDAAPVPRSGARAGDVIAVTGALGASAAGLELLRDPRIDVGTHRDALLIAHARPVPRVEAGVTLAEVGANSMMDCSDGLALDITRLAAASGVTTVVDLDAVPIAPGVETVARARAHDPARFAATGGEDYELIVTATADTIDRARRLLDIPLTVVGRVEPGLGRAVFRVGRRNVTLDRLGWET